MSLQFSFQLRFIMTLLLFIWTIDIVNSYPHWHRSRSPADFNNPSIPMEKAKTRRGMNLNVTIANKKPALELEFLQEIQKLLNDTKIIPSKDFCPDCSAIQKGKEKETVKRQDLKPAYNCDQWDPKTRTCWVDRNVGNTVTFVLSLPPTENKQSLPKVEWKQVFQTLRSNHVKHINIDTNNPPWNIVVGSAGYELRLSPITEVDVDYNFFVATVHSEESIPLSQRTVRFRIRVMPIDQGLVYPGASLLINMFTFVSLPEESITFRWSLEKELDDSLPSNMRLSLSGGVLSISELRKEQEGIVVCSVFTNLGIFATQKRFLIRGVDQDNNLLVFMATRPPYQHDGRRKREVESMDYTKEDSKSYAEDDNPLRSRVTSQQESSLENGDEEFDENSNRNVENGRGSSRNKGLVQEEQGLQKQESNKDLYPNSEMEQSDQNRRSQDRLNQLPDTKNSKEGSSRDDTDSGILYQSSGQLEPSKNLSSNHVPRPNVIESDSKEMEQQNSKPSPGQYGTNQDRVRDVDEILAVEVKVPDTETQVRVSDEISILLAECRRNTQCSTYAECIKMDNKKDGFCRCLSRFEGSGIFCWEVYKIRT